MKKISLKDVKNALKRDEMRAIIGGYTCTCGSGPTSHNLSRCSCEAYCSNRCSE